MSKENKHLVSVYGTLRKGCSNHDKLKNALYKGSFESKPIFSMYSVNNVYPALKLNGNTSIVIEVYEVNDKQLKSIDELEGYNKNSENKYVNLYDRKRIFTPYGESYIYIYEGSISKYKKIDSGDWKDFEDLVPINEILQTI